jgi:hypothetical protein
MVWVFDVTHRDLERMDLRGYVNTVRDVRKDYRESNSIPLHWKRPKSFASQVKKLLYLDFSAVFQGAVFHPEKEPCMFRVLPSKHKDEKQKLDGYWLTKAEFLGRHARSVCIKTEEVTEEYDRLYNLVQAYREEKRKLREKCREATERAESEKRDTEERYQRNLEAAKARHKRKEEEQEKRRQVWLNRFADKSSSELAELAWRYRKEDMSSTLTDTEAMALLDWEKGILINYRRDIVRKALTWEQDRWHKLHVYLHDKAYGLLSFKERQILALAPNINAARKGLSKVYKDFVNDLRSKKMERVSKEWPCDICLSYTYPSCRRGLNFLDCYKAHDFDVHTSRQDRSGRTYYRYPMGCFGGSTYFYHHTNDEKEMRRLRNKIDMSYTPSEEQTTKLWAGIQEAEEQAAIGMIDEDEVYTNGYGNFYYD